MWTGSMRRGWLAGFVLAAAAWTASASPAAQVRVNEDARIGAEFLHRVEDYVALHRKLESTLPHLPDKPTPQQIETHRAAMARLMVDARRTAKQGDLFTRECRALFRRQLVRALSGPEGRDVRQSIMEENPGPITVRINGQYPDTVPVSTVPPQVLAALPRLPDDVEYRFIGRRLILLDVHSNLIVDYIDDALPR